MIARYLLDENLDPAFARQLILRRPGLTVRSIGDGVAPPKSTPDPDVLNWCEDHDFVLITNNRKSMPGHLTAHLSEGRHVPGILVLRIHLGFGRLVQELADIAAEARDDQFRDLIVYVP